MFDEITHAILYVRDMEASLSFWRDKVGLKPSFVGEKWVEFPMKNVIFALHPAEDAAPKDTGITFRVDDIHEAVRQLRERGVEVTEVWDIEIGLHAKFRDNEGNVFELFEPK